MFLEIITFTIEKTTKITKLFVVNLKILKKTKSEEFHQLKGIYNLN